jgi:hypothetical protein
MDIHVFPCVRAGKDSQHVLQYFNTKYDQNRSHKFRRRYLLTDGYDEPNKNLYELLVFWNDLKITFHLLNWPSPHPLA